MTDTNIDSIAAMLASLAAGKEAMEMVPLLESENKSLGERLDQCHAHAQGQADYIEDLAKKLQATQIALNDTEAALKDATFRETETRSKLDTLRSVVGGALEAVTEKVEAVSEAVSVIEDKVTEPEGQSDADPTPSASSTPIPQSDAAIHSAEIQDGAATFSESNESAERAQPFLGHESWRKPSSMTWGEWRNKGGEAPDWVADYDA